MKYTMRLMWAALVASLPTAIATAQEGRSLSGSDAIGRPKAFVQGMKPVIAVWYEDGVWNIRATSKQGPNGTRGPRVLFTGLVRVEGDGFAGALQGLDQGPKSKKLAVDWVTPDADRRGFQFKFLTVGFTDGVNFKPGPKATSIRFRLLVNGDDDPRRIIVGTKGVHPASADFTLPAKPE